MNDELLALCRTTREVVVDTGCNWTEAAAKTLKGSKLTPASRQFLMAHGLGQYARGALDRPKNNHLKPDPEALAAEALGQFIPYVALVRVFDIDGMHKRFIDCTAEDLELLAGSLHKTAAGFTRSAQFALDTKVECERVKAPTVAELPTATLARLDKNAPW